MTSTNDGKDVKSNQTSGQKGKTYYIELYKSLEAGLNSECKLRERTRFLCEAWRRVYTLCHHSVPSTQTHLVGWLQRHTSRILLQTEWQLPSSKDEYTKLDEAIGAFVSECHDEGGAAGEGRALWQQQLVQRGLWFQKILANPWGHPVLKRLLDSHGDSPTEEEVLEWLKEEGGVMFLTRLRQLAASKCDDLALMLASKIMDRVRAETEIVADADQVEECKDKPNPEGDSLKFANILQREAEFTKDVWDLLTDLEFVLLHKRDKRSRCIQLAKETPLRNGCILAERLQSRLENSPREKKLWKNAKEVATLIAQVVVARCMVVGSCGGAARAALCGAARLLARALAAPRLRAVAASLAAPAASARHLHALAAAVRAELKDKTEMIPFMCELYVRAITAGMNELERLKLKTEMETEARSTEKILASWFTQLGSLLSTSDRIQYECTLTAFSVHPSPTMYEKIKAAPTLPPVALDHLDQKEEETTSEFGSWANDSRSTTNLVKTSETLNLKQTLHQANVLSTAILTEGEGLGLGPELCQDIAVLLSGPRLKTLSWDMDRELLIENCRAYMERTNGGTRAVTTELKYLNLDPKAFQHLPEEEDDENDMFYGIEKGYEHLVEFQEPEEIWHDDLIHPEMVDSPYASSVDSEIIIARRKKKIKKIIDSSEEDSDPLSFMAEAKRKDQKKVRPHSKERSKERRKKKSYEEDPLASRDSSQDSRKETIKKEKKIEKKERKKKDGSQAKPKSLAHLVGMKVTNLDNKYTSSMTDSDYDSQGKSSLSLNSECTEDVVFDGLYSMDELKSPEHVQNDKMGLMKNNEFSIMDGVVTVNKPSNANKFDIDTNAMSPYCLEQRAMPTVLDMTSQPYLSTVREEVKKSISRLIEFRRNKKAVDSISDMPTTSTSLVPNAAPASYRMPSAIVRPESPSPAQISPKVVTIPEIPKMYINKKQSEQLTKLKNEVNRYLNTSNNVNPNYTSIHFGQPDVERNKVQNFSILRPSNPPEPVPDLIRQQAKHIKKIPSPPRPNMVSDNTKQINHVQNNSTVHNVPKQINTTGTHKQKNFQEFLKELQESINAGAGVHSETKAPPAPYTPPRKEVKPMTRPTPIVPLNMKVDSKVTPSAKPQTQPKKLDVSLNTFSRLSYMHKNKQCDTKLQQLVNALIEHQDQNLKKLPKPRILDRVASEPKIVKPKCSPAKIETATRPVKNPNLVKFHNNLLNKKVERPPTSVNQLANACPVISSILQNNNASSHRPAEIKNDFYMKTSPHAHHVRHEPKPTSLSEKDQNDLVLLLRQQNKLNASYITPKREGSLNRDAHTTHSAQSSTSNNVTTTKFTTKADLQLSNKDMQATKPIICESLKPKKPSSLTGVKVLNHAITVSKASVPKAAHISRNHSKTDSSEHNYIKKTEVKTENKLQCKNETPKITKTATDWESVMDAILAQKTPSRGPKALDVALNKSSFAKAFSDSIQNQKLIKSNSAGEITGIKDIKRVLVSQGKPGVIISGHKIQQNAQKSASVKTHSRKSSTESKHTSKSSHSKTSSNSPEFADVSSSKPYSGEVPRKVNHHEPHRKLSSEELKKQFTCPLPKDDDPFISGIANSDYDLLEELMDDDLRQEIGELSTDEDDYNPAAPNVSKRKNIITEKRVAEAFSKLTNALPIAATTAMDLCINQTRDSNKTTTQMQNMDCDFKMPNVYDKKLPPTEHIPPLLVNDNNSSIPMAHKLSTNTTTPRTERVVTADNILPTLDTSNLYIAALPKQRYQNIVVINSDLVYDAYPTVHPSIHSTIDNIQQNSYVPPTNTANGAMYQTAEYSAPVINPLIIENCVTASTSDTTDKVTSSLSTSMATMKTASHSSKPADSRIKKQNNDNYTTPPIPCLSANDQRIIVDNSLPDDKMNLDFNSKNCETKLLTKVDADRISRGKKVLEIIRQSSKSQESSTSDEHKRLAKKRTSIINRKLSHRCDNEPIPLSFTPLDTSARRSDQDEQSVFESNHIKHQSGCAPIIPSHIENITNININAKPEITNENNKSVIVENNHIYGHNIAESESRRILLRSSNKLDQPVLLKQSSKMANHTKMNPNTKDDVLSEKLSPVIQTIEKGTPKPRSRKRPPKKTNNTTEKVEQKEKTNDRVSKNSKGVVKNQRKTNKKSLKNIVSSNNSTFLGVENEVLSAKLPRLFGSNKAVLPEESVIGKMSQYPGSSTEALHVGGLEGHVQRGPKPIEAELFDDLTQFSCDTVSFENIIKEKALFATDFHKENVASPIPILTSTDIETVLEKNKLPMDNKETSKENTSMNFTGTNDREVSEKTSETERQTPDAPVPTEIAITQASVSTLGLNQDNAPFFKQVISEIQQKANKQKQATEGVKPKQFLEDIERKGINEDLKQKQNEDVNNKQISNESVQQDVAKVVNPEMTANELEQQEIVEDGIPKQIAENNEKLTTDEVEEQGTAQKDEPKPTIAEAEQKQMPDNGKQISIVDEIKQKADKNEQMGLIDDVQQHEIASEVEQIVVEDDVLPVTIDKPSCKENSKITLPVTVSKPSKLNSDITLANSSDSSVDLVDGVQSKVSCNTPRHKVNTEPEIPQSYRDNIKIEQIPSGSKDPLQQCLRIKLPNGRTFKATVYGKVLLDVDTLFEEPSLKSLLLSSLTDKKYYTLNIKQVSTASVDNPSKIVETRIQEINIESKTAPNLVETINLLSDDEDEEVFQYFKTEFGNYKIRPLANRIFSSHQNKFSQKCQVHLIKMNMTTLEKLKYANTTLVTHTFYKPTCPEIINSTKRTHKRLLIPSKIKINSPIQDSEVIHIDDSSSESFVDKQCCEGNAKTVEQTVTVGVLKESNLNCYVKLIRCDDLVKKNETQKALKQKCYVDLVRIDTRNMNCLKSHDLIAGNEEDKTQSHPRSKHSEIEMTGRTSPVMEVYESIARLYNKTHERLKMHKTMQYEKQDNYLCKSMWLDTKRIVSNLTIQNNNETLRNGFRPVQFADSIQHEILPLTNNELNNPASLRTLTMEYFQNNAPLNYIYTSSLIDLAKYQPRRISYPIKRKLNIDHGVVSNKISKWSNLSKTTEKQKQFIENENCYLKSNVAMITQFEDQDIIEMKTAVQSCEENILSQNISNDEINYIPNEHHDNNIDRSGGGEKLVLASGQRDTIDDIVESNDPQINSGNTKTNNIADENGTTENHGVNLMTKDEINTSTTSADDDLKCCTRINGIYEPVDKMFNDVVDMESSKQNTDNDTASNYLENNNINSNQNHEHDKNIEVSYDDYGNIISQSKNTNIRTHELEEMEPNIVEANKNDNNVGMEHSESLSENYDNDKDIQNKSAKATQFLFTVKTQETLEDMAEKTQGREFTQLNAREENETDLSYLTNGNSHDNIHNERKHSHIYAENNVHDIDTSYNVIINSICEDSETYIDSVNASEEAKEELQRTEPNESEENKSETLVSTEDNADRENITTKYNYANDLTNVSINNTTVTSNEELQASKLDMVNEKQENSHQHCVIVSEKTDNDKFISNAIIEASNCDTKEIQSETENTFIKGQKVLKTIQNTIVTNKTDATETRNNIHDQFINIDYCDSIISKCNNVTSKLNESLEIEVTVTHLDTENMFSDEENKLDSKIHNFINNKSDMSSLESNDRNKMSSEMAHCGTLIDNSQKEHDGPFEYDTYETNIKDENIIIQSHKEAETADQNGVEENKAGFTDEDSDNRFETSVQVENWETVVIISDNPSISNELSKALGDVTENNTRSETAKEEIDKENRIMDDENKTNTIQNNKDDGDKISNIVTYSETKFESPNKGFETLNSDATELYSKLKNAIKKSSKEFETIQNSFEDIKSAECRNDLSKSLICANDSDTEKRIDDTATPKNIDQNGEKIQEPTENIENIQDENQNMYETAYEVKPILFSNVDHKVIVFGDHDYVGKSLVKPNESVKTLESDSKFENKETNDDVTTQDVLDDDYNTDDTIFNLLMPVKTYKKECEVQDQKSSYDRKGKNNSKRKKDMSDIKFNGKRYKKGRNIDAPKSGSLSSGVDISYGKEYKALCSYNSSLKFSYSRPFHRDHIDVQELLTHWPITNTTKIPTVLENESEKLLFLDLEDTEKFNNIQSQSLADELLCKDVVVSNNSDEIKETNFNMGFGERSDRVILNLEDGVDVSEVSAATLSDVKQNQPVLQSEYNDSFFCPHDTIHKVNPRNNMLEGINRYYTSVQLKNKVKDFFKQSAIELNLMQDYRKSNKDKEEDTMEFLFGLSFIDFPPPPDIAVHVVQVGQLSVSPPAQNPVTCDPRVTQVSNASPPQCSADNSMHDDHEQVNIKTEYTELTTADITLPMVPEYEHHGQLVPYEYQESSNIPIINENIPIQTEIKSVVKIELMEEEDKIETNELTDHNECKTHEEIVNNVHYPFEVDHTNASPEPPRNMEIMYESEKHCNGVDEFSPLSVQNGMSEKNDQIAHAMSAAGISTTAESVSISATSDHDYNMLAQNTDQKPTLPNGTDTYRKTSTINTMALQQALAQILPPPLNQVNGSENNQQSSNAVTSQVLRIVQGKNGSGNQVTLVDNAQPSVINGPNASPMLHIVQNKSATTATTPNGAPAAQSNNFNGLSLVDTALQKSGNQLLHIVNAANQNNNNAGQLLKRVNLLTNLANAQVANEQKVVQFVCKSDGKAIQLNAAHQRSMVLRLQPVETPSVQTNPPKPPENPESSPKHVVTSNGEASPEKSRTVYEENYTKYAQGGSTPTSEKATSLPKFNQAFGKQVFQEEKQNELNGNSHMSSVSSDNENTECPMQDNPLNLEHMGQVNSPPLLVRKSPPQTPQSQPNIVQQIKETIAPMNIQTMHGGVIYTRQIPVNIGGGQTINLITVPTTELVDESGPKQQAEVKFVNQSGIEPSIIKIVPQTQPAANGEATPENNSQANGSTENNQNPQPPPVLTQMRIKLPMLSKAPNVVSGTRVIRPSFFHIQRNVIGGANQQVYQQLVLTAAPPLGQQTIRLPQAQTARPPKSPESQSSNESQMSSSTLEQLREFDLVLEQVKERSTVQPSGNVGAYCNVTTSSTDATDGAAPASSTTTEPTQQQVLYSIGNTQPVNVAYVNRKTPAPTPTTSSYVRSPDSSGVVDSSTSPSSSQASTSHTVTSEVRTTDPPPQPKKHKSKPRPKASSNPPSTLKFTTPPKQSSQKPLEDEQTTQRILYILAEYKEQVENSPDKDKPAPRRRNNLPTPPSGSSKRKKGGGHRRLGPRAVSPLHGDETCRTMGSEDSSCGTSLGDCNDSCIDNHSPHDSPRKVVRKLTFDNEPNITQPKPQPPRNVIVADGQTITVARGTAGKPTAVFMPANYILPVSMVKGGQQIAIVTNRGPKLLTVSSGGEGGTTNALLLQRLIGPGGLKPVLARPGFRHVRLPAAALQNLQAFNLTTAATVQPPDSTASPASAPAPPDLVESRPASSSWTEKESQEVKPERESSPEGSEPWNIHTIDPMDYSYEETVRTENMDRTVLDPIPDRYSPDMEAQRIFDKMFDVDSKKSYMVDSHDDSPRCGYDIDTSDCDDKAYHQVVHKREGHRQHRLTHVSAAALRHKYAILEHELRLQKSLSEECEDLGVDSPSASELFPEAELLFTASPAHDHAQEHPHSSQPVIHIPKPDLEDQIATDRLISRDMSDRPDDLNIGLEDVGIVTVSEDGLQTTITLNQEEFARAHPNTTFHSEPSEEGEVQPLTITDLKSRHITSTIFHANRAPGTVLVTAPQTTVISQATAERAASSNIVKYTDIENMIDSLPGPNNNNNIDLPSVVVKDNGMSRFDSLLAESRGVHITNTTSAIVHSSGHATQVIRRVCFDDDKREKNGKYLIDEPDAMMAGDDTKIGDISRDAALGSMRDDGEDRSSPDRHGELFWDSNSMVERIERRRRLDFSSDSDKCCRSPTYDDTNSDSGVGVHMRLDSVIKEARLVERTSVDGSVEDNHPPLRTYPPKRLYHTTDSEMDRSLSGKTRSPDMLEVRRRSSVRGVVKRGCHCCNGSPAPPRPKKPRPKKPTMDFTVNN